jgi:hypothetical protein
MVGDGRDDALRVRRRATSERWRALGGMVGPSASLKGLGLEGVGRDDWLIFHR